MTDVDSEILGRLDVILRVLALQVAADKGITERARLLKLAGMDNRSIAEVLNTSDATVRTLTANLRRRPSRAVQRRRRP
jgi:transposase